MTDQAPRTELLRESIEAELALVVEPVGPFDAGAAAAYHWVLSKLAEGDAMTGSDKCECGHVWPDHDADGCHGDVVSVEQDEIRCGCERAGDKAEAPR